MARQYAIWDMDGTLVDSMGFWKSLAVDFLKRKGVETIPVDLLKSTRTMTMTESAALFIKAFKLSGTPENVAEEMNGVMERHYREDIELKKGIKKYLMDLHKKGVSMCVASATAENLMKECLKRLDVINLFDFCISCEAVVAGKNRPHIFLEAARRFGAFPEEVTVYEDAIYAVKTAKVAGFYVVGVYDEHSKRCWNEIKTLADETMFF